MKTLNKVEAEWIESWTVEEAIAVNEFCTLMQDYLWRLDEIALDEHVLEREGLGDPRYVGDHEQNLELPFDDNPF